MVDRDVFLRDRIDHVVIPVDAGRFLPPGGQLSKGRRPRSAHKGGGVDSVGSSQGKQTTARSSFLSTLPCVRALFLSREKIGYIPLGGEPHRRRLSCATGRRPLSAVIGVPLRFISPRQHACIYRMVPSRCYDRSPREVYCLGGHEVQGWFVADGDAALVFLSCACWLTTRGTTIILLL